MTAMVDKDPFVPSCRMECRRSGALIKWLAYDMLRMHRRNPILTNSAALQLNSDRLKKLQPTLTLGGGSLAIPKRLPCQLPSSHQLAKLQSRCWIKTTLNPTILESSRRKLTQPRNLNSHSLRSSSTSSENHLGVWKSWSMGFCAPVKPLPPGVGIGSQLGVYEHSSLVLQVLA